MTYFQRLYRVVLVSETQNFRREVAEPARFARLSGPEARPHSGWHDGEEMVAAGCR
jgi:hypothetical protein